MGRFLKILIFSLVSISAFCLDVNAKSHMYIERDTFRNSVIETFGLSYRSPALLDSAYTKATTSGGTDFHVGFQYNRQLPLGFYATIKGNYSRHQNVMNYTRTVNNTLFQGDSLYRETIVTKFDYTNSYIFVDGGIGLGKLLKYNRLALDVSAIANYRIIAFTNVHVINSEEQLQQYTEVDYELPDFPLVIEANAYLRYYVGDEAYFLFGMTYQTTPVYTHTDSQVNQSFDSLIYKLGYGFNF